MIKSRFYGIEACQIKDFTFVEDDALHIKYSINDEFYNIDIFYHDWLNIENNIYCNHENSENEISSKIKILHWTYLLALEKGYLQYIKVIFFHSFSQLYKYLNSIEDENNYTSIQRAAACEQWLIVIYFIEQHNYKLNQLSDIYKNKLFEFFENNNIDAFYFSIKLGCCNTLKYVIDIRNLNDYSNNLETAKKLDSYLSEAYEELLLKRVPISQEMQYFVEELLISLRFLSRNEELNNFANNLDNVLERIRKISELFDKLCEHFNCHRKVDQLFITITEFIAQNMHILKNQIKFTYVVLPWEEMEFYVAVFNLYHTNMKFNLFLLFNESRLIEYLRDFIRVLKSLTYDEELLKKKLPSKNTVTTHATFRSLCEEYYLIKDIYSLERIRIQLEMIKQLDISKNIKIGRVIIEKALIVIGESLKSSLQSSNISQNVQTMLDILADKHLIKTISDIRDKLAHSENIPKKEMIDDSLYLYLRKELIHIIYGIKIVLYIKQNEAFKKSLSEFSETDEQIESYKDAAFKMSYKNEMEVIKLEDLKKLLSNCRNLVVMKKILLNVYKHIPLDKNYEIQKEIFIIINNVHNHIKNQTVESKEVKDLKQICLHLSCSAINFKAVDEYYDIISEYEINKEIDNDKLFNFKEYVKSFEIKLLDVETSSYIKLFSGVNFENILKFKDNMMSNIPQQIIEEQELMLENCIKNIANEINDENVVINYAKSKEISTIKTRILNMNEEDYYVDQFENICQLDIKLKKKKVNSLKDVKTLLKRVKYPYEDLFKVISETPYDFHKILSTFQKLVSTFIKAKNMSSTIQNMMYEAIWLATIENSYSNSINTTSDILDDDNVVNENTLLRSSLDIFVLEILEICNSFLSEDKLFFDLYFPLPIGRTLRNHSAHGNILVDNLELNKLNSFVIKKFISMNTDVLRYQLIGHTSLINFDDLNKRYERSIKVIEAQNRLFKACYEGSFEDVDECIKGGADFYGQSIDDSNILYFAAGNKLEHFKKILTNFRVTGINFVMYLFNDDKTDIIEILLRNNVINCNTQINGLALIHHAILNNCPMMLSYLLSIGSNVNIKGINDITAMHLAVLTNQENIFNTLIKYNAHVDICDINGYTPLHYASVMSIPICSDGVQFINNESQNMVKLLLENLCNLNLKSTFGGYTALYGAVENCHEDNVKALLNKDGILINQLTTNGIVVLQIAAKRGYDNILELLIKHKDIDITSNIFYKAIDCAAENGHINIINILNSYNTLATDRTEGLHGAAKNGHIDVALCLLKHGYDINCKSNNGYTPLHFAIQNKQYDMVTLLITHGANVNAVSTYGHTPLYCATVIKDEKMVKFLLDKGALVNNGLSLYTAAERGYENIVKLLITANADLNRMDITQYTAIHKAAENGHENVIQILLKNNAELYLKSTNFYKTIYWVATKGYTSILKLFIENGADINNIECSEALCGASLYGHEDTVKFLIENNANVNYITKYGDTALGAAASKGYRKIVQILLDKGAIVNNTEQNQVSALCEAAIHGHDKIVKMLLDNGADINQFSTNGLPAICCAAKNGHSNIINILLNHGVDVDQKSKYGTTALYSAAAAGNLKCTKILLNNNANVNYISNGLTALYKAANQGHENIVNILLQHGAKVNIDSEYTPLRGAVNSSKNIVQTLIHHGADLNKTFKYNFTILHHAVSGDYDIMKLLLENNLNINAVTNNGDTSLHFAVRKGHEAIVTLLLMHGADVNLETLDGITPIYWSINNGYPNITKMLLDKGAKADIVFKNKSSLLCMAVQNKDETTVRLLLHCNISIETIQSTLYLAVEKGLENIAKMLIDKGADVNGNMLSGYTLLCEAIKNYNVCSENAVNILIANGVDVNKPSENQKTPLYTAALSGNLKATKILLANNACVNQVSVNGYTALFQAAYFNYENIVIELIKNKANVNHQCDHGYKPIFHAASNGCENIVNILLQNGAHITNKSPTIFTTLYTATEFGSEKLVTLLLKNGADVNQVSPDGLKALDVAKIYEYENIVKILLDHGAI